MLHVLRTLVCCLLVTIVPVAFAGEGHDHNHEAAVEPAPRGGMLRDAPPYKVELLLEKDLVRVFIYDAELKPVAREKLAASALGQLRFPKEKSHRELPFTLGADSYEATAPGISAVHRYDLHVTFDVAGRKIIGDFGVDNIH